MAKFGSDVLNMFMLGLLVTVISVLKTPTAFNNLPDKIVSESQVLSVLQATDDVLSWAFGMRPASISAMSQDRLDRKLTQSFSLDFHRQQQAVYSVSQADIEQFLVSSEVFLEQPLEFNQL